MFLFHGSLFLKERAERETCYHLAWHCPHGETGQPELVMCWGGPLVWLASWKWKAGFPLIIVLSRAPGFSLTQHKIIWVQAPKRTPTESVKTPVPEIDMFLFPSPLFPHMPMTWIWNALFIWRLHAVSSHPNKGWSTFKSSLCVPKTELC